MNALSACGSLPKGGQAEGGPVRLSAVLAEVHERFAAAPLCYGQGTDNAWDEAVALALGVTGLPDEEASLELAVGDATLARIRRLAERRIAERRPLAQLLGVAPYCGLRLRIEPGLVVPRSAIGPLLLSGLRPWLREAPTRVLDLCCGCGALGLLAARQFPAAEVTLADLDPLAVAVARRNVADLGLSGRTQVVHTNLFAGLADNDYDLILCNPPYVDAADMAVLPPEFAAEPAAGLSGGKDGLAVLRRLLDGAGSRLTAHGLLVAEAGLNAWRVRRAWPGLPFIWPDLPAGGTGVFLLDATALRSHTAAKVS